MSPSAQEMIAEALQNANSSKAGVQPVILFDLKINTYLVTDVAQHTVGEPGSSAHDKIGKMLNEGWIMFRIQTEFCSLRGHVTVAYFVKMR